MPKFGEKPSINPVAEEEKRIAREKGQTIISDASLDNLQKSAKLDSLRALALSVGKTTRAKVYLQQKEGLEPKKEDGRPGMGADNKAAFLIAKKEAENGALNAVLSLIPALRTPIALRKEHDKWLDTPAFGSYSPRALADCPEVGQLSDLIGIGREEISGYLLANARRLGQWMENLKKDRGMQSIYNDGVEFKGPRADVADNELARVCAMALVGERALGVQAEFTLNIINQESQFKFDAIWSGGVGGMQLTSNSVVQFNQDVKVRLSRWLSGRGLKFRPEWKYIYLKDEARGQVKYVRTSLVKGEKGGKFMPPQVRKELAGSAVLNMFYGMLHLSYIMERKGDDDIYIVARSYNGNLKLVRGAKEIIKVCDDYAKKIKGRYDFPWPNFCYSDEKVRQQVKLMKSPKQPPLISSLYDSGRQE